MNYVNPNTEILTVTYNDITYEKEYYKPATIISGITDETHPNWAVGTTYAVGDYVIVPELKRIYRSVVASNLGNFPLIAGNTNWVDWGTINSYNMFANDSNIGSQTSGTDIVMEFDFSKSNTIAGIDLDFVTADMILLRTDTVNYLGDYNAGTTYAIDDAVLDGGIFYSSLVGSNLGNTPASSPTEWAVRNDLVFFDETITGTDYGALSYGEYFYTDATVKKRIVMTDFEWLPSSVMRITLNGAASIGSIVYGLKKELGATLVGSVLKFQDKSTIVTDEISGYRSVTRYGSVRVLDCSVIFDTLDFDATASKIEDILSKNILWIPTDSDKFSSTITIGYIENFDIPMESIEKTKTTTTIVGVAR